MIDQIAAGEVVERPASVIKELLENALDAGATRVQVDVEGGGRQRIRILDNGTGMSADEARLAIERHATSKLTCFDDLQRIATLGFRGEALASIRSVSRFTLSTRDAAATLGTRLASDGGAAPLVSEVAMNRGTEIDVRDLFYNVPARLKFLKKEKTELGWIAEIVQRYALGYPTVHITLSHNGRELASYPCDIDLRQRLHTIFGPKVAASMVAIEQPIPPRVLGFISPPTLSKNNTSGLYSFVNGRFVRDPTIQKAIQNAYGSLLETRRYPYAAIFVSVEPALVDVNVHPMKHEVRFADSGSVYHAVHRAVTAALAESAWLSGANDGRSDPGPDFTSVADGRLGVGADFAGLRDARGHTGPLGANRMAPSELGTVAGRGASRYSARPGDYAERLRGRRDVALRELAELQYRPGRDTSRAASGDGASRQLPLVRGDELGARGFYGSLRYVGQVLDCYLVCESGDAVHLIDQHAAHERLTYERLRRQFLAREVARQRLLFPVNVALTQREEGLLEENLSTFERLGFEIARFGPETHAIKEIPALLGGVEPEALLRDLLYDAIAFGHSRILDDHLDALLSKMACHSSIRAGHKIRDEEVARLFAELDRIDFSANCPHGRPIVVTLSAGEILHRFNRS
ncbi:MAG: DNA mismatch repair endonuclease MutL [Myxococcales bacterium]|nr:DNA mismatch repair endonuclease MutL [Myxococcales bacterium]